MTATFDYFDGHNDVLMRLVADKRTDADDFLRGYGRGDIDLPRAKSGQMTGGLFAMWCAPDETVSKVWAADGTPIAPPLTLDVAQRQVAAELAVFQAIVREGKGQVRHCLSVADIRAAKEAGDFAMVLHLEGADALDGELTYLDTLYTHGLRSLGLVWSRPTIFGEGVPFAFPASPDIGAGLTDAGKRLVLRCNELRILIDLSHLNEKGFWDVADLSNAPLVASHSNAHALCPSPRNLTDLQLDVIAKTSGFVGYNFGTYFTRADGVRTLDPSIDEIMGHFDRLLSRLGEGGVGIGSDYDGVRIPAFIGDVSKVQKLFEAMSAHGYSDELIARIAGGNWLDMLERTWGG